MEHATWYCAQLGAREEYAIPRALYSRNKLRALATNFWAGGSFSRVAMASQMRSLVALGQRRHADIPDELVKSWNLRSLAWTARIKTASGNGSVYDAYVDIGERFSRLCARHLARIPADLVEIAFAYDTTALELFREARRRGMLRVLGQIDPHQVEFQLVQEEEARWPGWSIRNLRVSPAYLERRVAEWHESDVIIVNSEFSRAALNRQGVPSEKLVVVPLAYEGHVMSRVQPLGASPRLKVLFLGQVILRKGIQYLIEAARLLQNEMVEFSIVGEVGISPQAVRTAPANVRFYGHVSRRLAQDFFANSDVFVLPTISDGFALTQLQAMARGLPVIATRNCGDVVRDGRDGMIVPIRDSRALAEAIMKFQENREWLLQCSQAGYERARMFSLSSLMNKLEQVGSPA